MLPYIYIYFLASSNYANFILLALVSLSTPSVGVCGYIEGEYSFIYKDHFDKVCTGYKFNFSTYYSFQVLKLYTVSISLTSISGSDRFVADRSCS